MTDRLTQLQDCLDDLMTQMYATLNYIQTRHPYGDIPGQPSQAPDPAPAPPSAPQSAVRQSAPALTNDGAEGPDQAQQGAGERPTTPPPEQPVVFRTSLKELAQGLVLKEQQMEILINSLPGLGNHEEDQVARMRELERELREVEKERADAEDERERLADGLGDLIANIGRLP